MVDQRRSIAQLFELLDQGRRLALDVDIELYRRAPAPLTRSPVGAHIRHVLDCFRCFLDGLSDGRVDYDCRSRDSRTEMDPSAAVEDLTALARRLTDIRDLDPETPIAVRSDVTTDDAADATWRTTTVGRELLYVLSHTVHHYALIAMILRHFGEEPGEDFGVAPSTLRYWKESEGCAPLVG